MQEPGNTDQGNLLNGRSPPGAKRALGAGLAGALALTAVHEGVRRLRADAPRMDKVAGKGIAKIFRKAGLKPPRAGALYGVALTGDLLSNAAYYATLLLGRPRHPWLRQALGGLIAGAAALALPSRLGLGRPPRAGRRSNQLMTYAWYLLGGLSAAAVYQMGRRRSMPY